MKRTQRLLSLLPLLFLTSCTNVSTTKFSFTDHAKTVEIEMPKEIDAEELIVEINADKGSAVITAKSWKSRNRDTIDAQTRREKARLDGAAGIVEEGAKGVVEGAVKGLLPLP